MTSELLLPEGVPQEMAFASVRERLELRDGASGETDQTYYDTFDGLLHEEGLCAVCTAGSGRLALAELGDGAVRSSGPLPAAERMLPIEFAPGPLRDQLISVVDVRALLGACGCGAGCAGSTCSTTSARSSSGSGSRSRQRSSPRSTKWRCTRACDCSRCAGT
jgi:hypothetical protein